MSTTPPSSPASSQQSHPGSIMSSYNEVNGVPAAGERPVDGHHGPRDVRVQRLFHQDCDAIYEIQAGHHWQSRRNSTAPLNQYGRTAYANSAGEDLDCNAGYPTVQLREHHPDRDHPAHHNADRHLQRRRRRHLAGAPVHRPDRDRRVRRRGPGSLGGGKPARPRRDHLGQQQRQQRRHRDPGPAGAGTRSRRPEHGAAEELGAGKRQRPAAAEGPVAPARTSSRSSATTRTRAAAFSSAATPAFRCGRAGQRRQRLPGHQGGRAGDQPDATSTTCPASPAGRPARR